jgi:hypothetical protein
VLLITGAALGYRFGRMRMFVVDLGIFTGARARRAVAEHRRADRGPSCRGSAPRSSCRSR